MTLPITSRRYQIDYMSGLRYVFSPAYRSQVRNTLGRNTGLKVLYMIGGLVSTAVVISALLFLRLRYRGCYANHRKATRQLIAIKSVPAMLYHGSHERQT